MFGSGGGVVAVAAEGGGAGPGGAGAAAPRRDLPKLLPQFALQVGERLQEGVLELEEAGDFMLQLLK